MSDEISRDIATGEAKQLGDRSGGTGYRSSEEARAAIQRLHDIDKKKLAIAARFWWKFYGLHPRHGSAQDLVQEAVLRTWQNRRRWRDEFPIVKHLDLTMSSIASHARDSELQFADIGDDALEGAASCPSTTERSVLAKEQLDKLQELFADDPEAIAVLHRKSLGLTASEIQEALRLSSSRWETVRKRIQRKLSKYANTGGRK